MSTQTAIHKRRHSSSVTVTFFFFLSFPPY